MSKAITEKKRTLIFINILISCIASSMLATALTTALPPIITELNISITTGQWLTSGYSLVMGIMMPLTAFLIKRFPTKKLYCFAIVAFIVGLIICVLTSNFLIMMIGRIIQACGNGILTSMAQVILLTIYPPEKRGTIMGWYGLSIGAAPVIAPTLAGILVDTVGWRMIFYIAIAIMAVSLIFTIFVFDNVLNTTKNKFDIVSFILSAFAFGGITLGIGNIGSYDFISIQVLLVLIIGCIAFVLFIMRQLKLDIPFLNIRILKKKEYAFSVIGSMVLYLVMMGSSIILPVYVQSIIGESATIAGLVSLPGSLAMTVFSPFAGKIFDKIGMKPLFVAGAAFMLLSNIGMVFINMQTSVWIAAALNVVRNISIGCLMMPLVTWGTCKLPPEFTADATALLTSLRTIAGAIGSAVFVAIMTAVAASSAESFGADADIHGLNITFLVMSIFCVLLLAIAIFGVKKENKKGDD